MIAMAASCRPEKLRMLPELRDALRTMVFASRWKLSKPSHGLR